MQDTDYENAWAEGEAAAAEPGAQPVAQPAAAPTDHKPEAPATNAVVEAAKAQRDQDAKEFSDAWNMADQNDKNVPMAEPEKKAEPASFKEAFKQARAAGLKVFEWQGKKYTTDLAAAPAQKQVPMGNEARHSVQPATRPGVTTPDAQPSDRLVSAPPKSAYLAQKV